MTKRFVGWFADPVISYMSAMAAAGANAVSMGPYCRMKQWNDPTVGAMAGTPSQFIQAMQYARSKGLQVVLKPIVDSDSYQGDPNHSGFRAGINPSNITSWMSSYWTTCFKPYLPYVDAVAIHTELGTISSLYPGQIISLIQEIRMAGFAGPITTSQDFDPLGAPYWNSLDWIGGDAYPTIRTDSLSHAVTDWQTIAQQAAVANGQTGCATYFGELCPNIGKPMSAAQITTVYKAFWEVFGPLDYWAGVGIWRWPQDGSSPAPAVMTGVTGGLPAHLSYSAATADSAVSSMIQAT